MQDRSPTRIGGGEFAVIVNNMDTPSVEIPPTPLNFHALCPPFSRDSKERIIGTSIGIAFFPIYKSDGLPLMHARDLALYRAKDQGRCQFVVYDERFAARMWRHAIYSIHGCWQSRGDPPLNSPEKIDCEALTRKPKDYKSGITPIWCPGYGHHSVLNGVYKALHSVM